MASKCGKRSGGTSSRRPGRFADDYGKPYAPKEYPDWIYDEIIAVRRSDDRALAKEARDGQDDAASFEPSPPVVAPRVPRKLLPMDEALEQLRAPE